MRPLSKADMHCAAPAAETTATSSSSPIVELRQYQLHPPPPPPRTSICSRDALPSDPSRKKNPLPLAFVGFPETGSIALDTSVRLYHYSGGHAERLDGRSALAGGDTEISRYSGGGDDSRRVMRRSSEIFAEAPLVGDFEEITGLKYWVDNDGGSGGGGGGGDPPGVNTDEHPADGGNSSIVELRKYQLKLGYDTVPEFLRIYAGALPSKLNADGTHPTTELVTVLVSDVGSLNTVYEVWKHGGEIVGRDTSFCGLRAMETSRRASRGAAEWRDGIARIAELATTFDTTILRPLGCSPLQ